MRRQAQARNPSGGKSRGGMDSGLATSSRPGMTESSEYATRETVN
jgi:hypothetical protein